MKPSYGRILTTVGLMLSVASAGAQSPQKLVDELLSVDRDYARRAQGASVVDALGAMFADRATVSTDSRTAS